MEPALRLARDGGRVFLVTLRHDLLPSTGRRRQHPVVGQDMPPRRRHLRCQAREKRALCAAVRRLFVRAVTSWIERRARDAMLRRDAADATRLELLGFRSFSVRGMRKVAGEFSLVAMALNLERMKGLQTA